MLLPNTYRLTNAKDVHGYRQPLRGGQSSVRLPSPDRLRRQRVGAICRRNTKLVPTVSGDKVDAGRTEQKGAFSAAGYETVPIKVEQPSLSFYKLDTAVRHPAPRGRGVGGRLLAAPCSHLMVSRSSLCGANRLVQ